MANVFTQAKDLFKMQREAKDMQKKLREKKVSGKSDDGRVMIFFNAAQEYEDMNIDESFLGAESYDLLKRGFKEAFKDYQKNLQKEMMKDFDLDKLRGMLGSK